MSQEALTVKCSFSLFVRSYPPYPVIRPSCLQATPLLLASETPLAPRSVLITRSEGVFSVSPRRVLSENEATPLVLKSH
ncbi:hypothetical protein SRHO_G00056530 [Serrasalmus rhombeus]